MTKKLKAAERENREYEADLDHFSDLNEWVLGMVDVLHDAGLTSERAADVIAAIDRLTPGVGTVVVSGTAQHYQSPTAAAEWVCELVAHGRPVLVVPITCPHPNA